MTGCLREPTLEAITEADALLEQALDANAWAESGGVLGAPANFEALQAALGDVPAYAFGFAVIAMFWSGHVRWRALRGEGDKLSVALTLLIIFLTLIRVGEALGAAGVLPPVAAAWFPNGIFFFAGLGLMSKVKT